MLDTLGKRKCFDETLSSTENLRKKYRVVIGSTTDNNPLYQDAVFVGDSYVDDICGPGKVGMKTILIDRKHNFHCEKNEFRPWKITNSLENIMELVSE